ncbi:MAG: xanthine dehydrogenase family protein subunit M [Acidobacteriia bacterium]|nr:xanthine dehydrogenase family protein subunit M [Terriglobia bacterium]
MRAFEFHPAHQISDAIRSLDEANGNARICAGGTDLLSRLKDDVDNPERLVCIRTLPDLRYIRNDKDGVRIGALTTLSTIEEDAYVQKQLPLLHQALQVTAAPQIRNQATMGGSICQRPRCWYLRGPFDCLRKGGKECFAVYGENKYHAILGGHLCYIVHPSDSATALVALNASVKIHGSKGEKTVPIEKFFVGPEVNILKENILEDDEIITEVFIPHPAPGCRGAFNKSRERQSYDFALASAAVQCRMSRGVCEDVRVVLGGVAPIPWRSREAEAVVRGKKLSAATIREASEAALRNAKPLTQNDYKVDLTKLLLTKSFQQVSI